MAQLASQEVWTECHLAKRLTCVQAAVHLDVSDVSSCDWSWHNNEPLGDQQERGLEVLGELCRHGERDTRQVVQSRYEMQVRCLRKAVSLIPTN